MSLFDLAALFRRDGKLTDLVEQTALRCRDAVLERVCRVAPTLNSSQALGYIRARAAVVVHREIDLVDDPRLLRGGAHRQQFVAQTTDSVIRRVTAELAARERRQTPTRRAA